MKRAFPWIIAAIIIAVLAVGWLIFGNGLREWYYSSQAASALREGRPERAVEMFEKQLELSPRDDSLRLRLATLLAEQGVYSRAEYYLMTGIQQVADPTPLYIKLSEVYAAQDKLYDACELLNNISNPTHQQKVAAERPEAPVLSPAQGTYNEVIAVSVSVPDGYSCYISWEGEIPSTEKDKYTEPVRLEPGVTQVKAIMVDERGVVSGWTSGEYRLENVVFEISFEDSSIEALVRNALEKPEGAVRSDEVMGITEIISDEPMPYSTLSDLLYLPALEKLSLVSDSGGCDLSALPHLDSVTDLTLKDFLIDSVALDGVGQMVWLKKLSLESNMVSDFSALSGITGLETLNLATNSVLDISPVSSMPMLKELYLRQNAVQDLLPLSALAEIEVLDLSDNRIATLAGIESLSKLRILNVSHNYLEFTDAASGLKSLTEIYAASNRIASLASFSALSNLKVLDVSANALADVSSIGGLSSLERLDVSGNGIASLDGLGGCAALAYLEASKNLIKSVEPLRGHPALTQLRIESNGLTTLMPLLECPKLKEIYAFGNSLSDSTTAFAGTAITVYRN